MLFVCERKTVAILNLPPIESFYSVKKAQYGAKSENRLTGSVNSDSENRLTFQSKSNACVPINSQISLVQICDLKLLKHERVCADK
jgi:hypothetical protein